MTRQKRKCCAVCRNAPGAYQGGKFEKYGCAVPCDCHWPNEHLLTKNGTSTHTPQAASTGEGVMGAVMNDLVKNGWRVAPTESWKEAADTICSVRHGAMDDKQFRATVELNIEQEKQKAVTEFKEVLAAKVEGMIGVPTLCGNCNLNGSLCNRCYTNRQINSVIDSIHHLINEDTN